MTSASDTTNTDSFSSVLSMAFTICYYLLTFLFAIAFLIGEIILAHHIVHRVAYGRYPQCYYRGAGKHTNYSDADSTTESLLNDLDGDSPNNNNKTQPMPMSELPDYTPTEDNTPPTSNAPTAAPTPTPGGETTYTGLLNVLHTFLAVGVPFGIILTRAAATDAFEHDKMVIDLMTGVLVVSLVMVVLVGVEAGCAWVWNVWMKRVTRGR